MFEIGGKAKGFERKYNMNLHVMQTPTEKKHWEFSSLDRPLAVGRRLPRLRPGMGQGGDQVLRRWRRWSGQSKTRIGISRFYLTFDSETMPEWFGMPKDEDLPSTFSVEYVRAWKRK